MSNKHSTYEMMKELDHIIRRKKRLQKEFDSLSSWMKIPMVEEIITGELFELEREGNKLAVKLRKLGINNNLLSEFILACSGEYIDRYKECAWCSWYAPTYSWRHQKFYEFWENRYGIPF